MNPEILKTKQHFQTLDGLRGVAAFAIVIFHFMEWVISDFSKNFIGHGFLAVDFFFCLSGFVIGYAYDDRLAKMGVLEFFKSRLIRLHPLVFLGAVLGLMAFLFDPFGGQAGSYSLGTILLLFVCSVFLIPYPAMEDRAFNLFGLNAPSWSLFWEYVANIVYAFILYKLARRYLVALLLVAAIGLCYVSYSAGNLVGGWNGETFWHGGVRISYSFLAGLLVFRYNAIIKNKLGFAGLSILLSLAFLMPWNDLRWLSELFVVLIYFPLIVSLGAGTTQRAGTKKLCEFAGNISYPLYMTHYAVIWMFGNYFTTHTPGTAELSLVISVGTVLLLIAAYVVMVAYDIPLRKYLNKRRQQNLS